MERSEAEQKFWSIPEVVEALVSFLVPESTLHLAQSKVVDKRTLQKSVSSKVWNKLIRRRSSFYDLDYLIKISQLLELKEPSTFLLPLLDGICDMPWMDVFFTHVDIICPCHPEPHVIPPHAFLWLEEVEGAFGTAEQSIKSISVDKMREPLVSAISSRMSRQKETVASIEANWIFVENKSGAQALTTLLQAQEISVRNLGVSGVLGKKGWHMLAAAVSEIGPVIILITRQALAGARRYHIEEIWDAIPWVGGIHVYKTLPDEYDDDSIMDGLFVAKFDGHDYKAAWKRLKQIRDMTEDEFAAAQPKESDSESGEEAIEEEEEEVAEEGGEEDN